MPDERRPCVVQHPLNHAARGVLVPAVCLEHRADAFITLQLRFEGVILERSGSPIAGVQGLGENVDVLEILSAGVKVPPLVDRPPVLFRQHGFDAFDGGHCRAGTGF